jgi:hypothetical protein
MSSEGLPEEELSAEEAAPLPDREAMSTIRAGGLAALADNFAMPINEAVAINYQSTSSVAIADADQIVIIEQTDTDPDPS